MDAASVFLELALALRDEGAGDEMRSVDAEVRCLGAIVKVFLPCLWGREKEKTGVEGGEAIECSLVVVVVVSLD